MPRASLPQKIVCLFQRIPGSPVFFADDIHGIAIKEPCKTAMLARRDLYVGFVGFREKKNDGIVDPFVPDAE